MKIPFVDLKQQYQFIKEEINEVISRVLESGVFVGGEEVEAFEEEFARFCGTRYCVGVGSGTDALRFALLALGLGPGDEVLTVPDTFAATLEAIHQTGARSVLVDIEEVTYNLDPSKLEEKIGPRTKAILPVHLYGQCADMDPILEIAHRHHLLTVEDACQAHGAQYKGRKAGSLGDAAAFSFYPAKNLGAYGEGGAVTTSNEQVAQKVRMLRDHGQASKYHHDLEGYNGRLDALQAAILRVKLRHLPQWNEARRQKARLYGRKLGGLPSLKTPAEPEWSWAVWHLYVVRTRARDALQKRLREAGIETGLHYPVPLHRQRAFQCLGYGQGSFPAAEQHAQELLSLPLYPELSEENIELVAREVERFYHE